MIKFHWITVLLLLFPTSCVPTTQTTPQLAEADMPNEENQQPQIAVCPFVLDLPDIISSTVTEREASYQLVEPDRSVLSDVRKQLEDQGWTRTETTTDKLKGSSESRYTCAEGGTLRVTYGPVGKSLIYALRLRLE